MKMNYLAAVLFLLAAAAGRVGAQSPPPAVGVPDGGVAVIGTDWREEMVKTARVNKAFGAVEPSDAGLKLATLQTSEHIYDLQANALNRVAVKAGDTMIIRFAGRSLRAEGATGATRLRYVFGRASAPWTAGHSGELGLTHQWQRFEIPFKSPVSFGVGEARFNFTFGFIPQEVEIADLSVLNFGPETPLAVLPRTKLFADEVPADRVDSELTRIAAMKKELDAITDPAPANGKTIYVSVNGHANAPGTLNVPLATIPQALAIAVPGDTILVGPGDYHEPQGIAVTKSGRPDAWIKIKAAPGARPRIITSNWSGIGLRFGICYIEINGLEMVWADDPDIKAFGVGIAPMYACHHIRILNNVVHGYGTGGICSLDCDYLLVQGNVIYHTSHTSPYGGSGISLCRSFNFDENPGYHNVVRGNVCYDNENKVVVLVTSGGSGHTLTDGNGIIIDVFKKSRKNPLKAHGEDRDGPLEPYRGRTLVENNLCFNNGGRGIHIFRSAKVDVINNTCYMNQSTPEINGGEFTAIEATDVVIANNVAYGRPGKRVCGQDGSSGFVIWTHNLLYGEDALVHKDGIFDTDPLLLKPSLHGSPEDFELQPNSPAIGKGLASIAPRDDLFGHPRSEAAGIDLGAFQH
jgi:parallel beta-helix repeat protein